MNSQLQSQLQTLLSFEMHLCPFTCNRHTTNAAVIWYDDMIQQYKITFWCLSPGCPNPLLFLILYIKSIPGTKTMRNNPATWEWWRVEVLIYSGLLRTQVHRMKHVKLSLTIPSSTTPKTTCRPSSHEVLAVVMKNCEPFVSLPALAIDSQPAP